MAVQTFGLAFFVIRYNSDFRFSFSDRVSEHEIGDEEPKIEETSSGGDVDVNIEVDDDDVIIEEFSD